MTVEVDIYGNPVQAQPTGRRRVWSGRLHAELRRGEHVAWPFCRPHEDCLCCAVPCDHDRCPTQHNHISENVCPESCDACAALEANRRMAKASPATEKKQ